MTAMLIADSNFLIPNGTFVVVLIASERGESYRFTADEYRELDHERILVLVHHGGRGKTSGLELEQLRGGAGLFHVSDGKVTRLVIYADRERALADLGLTPEAG